MQQRHASKEHLQQKSQSLHMVQHTSVQDVDSKQVIIKRWVNTSEMFMTKGGRQSRSRVSKPSWHLEKRNNFVISGTILKIVIFMPKMEGHASFYMKGLLFVDLMETVTGKCACSLTKVKIWIFYPILQKMSNISFHRGANGVPPPPGWTNQTRFWAPGKE